MFDIIQQLTKNCDRKDCSIIMGVGTSTLMAWQPSYDKYGNKTSKDPNTHSYTATCRTCQQKWYIKEQEGVETKISILQPPCGG